MSNKNTPVSYVGKHTFTSDEKEQKLQQMLTAMREKEEIEAELKTAKSNYKSKIDSKDGEIKLMSNLLNAGWENKTYNCILVKNFDEGKRQYIELGTELLVGEEPLTAADYQTQMDLDEASIRENNESADQLQAVIEEKLEEAGMHVIHDDEEPPADLFEPEVDEDAQTEGNEWHPSEYTTEVTSEEIPPTQDKAVVNIDKSKKEDKKQIVKIETTPEDINPFGEDEEDPNEFNFDDLD